MKSADLGPSTGDETDQPELPPRPEPGRDTPQRGTPQYDAFISYSRGNFEVADKFERDLETFPLPRDIRKRLGRRNLNIFRDISDLTGNRLETGLEQKLQQSRTLVVLCSPAARRSRYVGMEIDQFAQLRGAEHIVPTLVAGGPNNDPTVDAADWAFPDALAHVLGSDPLATDLRQAWSIEGRKAKLARGSPWVQLVADIVGATTDDLTDRIAKAQRRRLQLAVGILAVVLAIVSVLGVVAAINWKEAQTQRDHAEARFREATSLRLNTEAESMLAGTRQGTSLRAYQEMIAARRLAQTRNDGPLFDTLVRTINLIKIVDTEAPVFTVAFSPNGTRIASTGDDGIRLWDAATGQPIGQPMTESTGSVVFSPDGTRIASTGDNGIRLWDAATGQPIGQPMTESTGFASVNSVVFSPDGTRIASTGDNGIRLWDAATGQPIGQPMTESTGFASVYSVAFSPDGTRIAAESVDGTIRIWNATTGQTLGQPVTVQTVDAPEGVAVIPEYQERVESVAFSPDLTRIVSGSSYGTLKLWDAATGQQIGQPITGHTGPVNSVAFAPDGTRIVSGSNDKTIRLWDPATGQPIGQPITGHTGPVNSVAFSPDGARIVSGSDDRTIRLWKATTGQPISQPMAEHTDPVNSVAVSPDGARIASVSYDGIRLWDATTGQPIGQPMTAEEVGFRCNSCGVAFSPDGARIASGAIAPRYRLWDAATGQRILQKLTERTDICFTSPVAFSPDGARIAAGCDNTVRLWDAATGQRIGEPMTGHTDSVVGVAFSPDGTRIASGSNDKTIRLWDATTGQPIGQPITGHTGPVNSVAFSPDGTRIASGSNDKTIRLWDATTGQPIGQPMAEHTGPVNSVAFSPDGTRIASGSNDGTIRLWDAATGQPIGQPMAEHTDAVTSFRFSPDGTRTEDTYAVTSVTFSPDGTRIVSGGEDGAVRVWPAFPDTVSAMCAKLADNMSHQQWRDWVSPDIDYIEVCPGLPILADR